jgi:hypothetical protein
MRGSGYLLCLALTCAVAAGCGVPLSTLHGPAPLEPHVRSVSAGLGPVFLDDGFDEDFLLFTLAFGPYASVRQGITDRLELGAAFGIFNGLSVDAKYNLLRGPVFLSADLALSRGVIVDFDIWGGDDEGAIGTLGLHPALMFGTERIYGGAKLMTFPGHIDMRRPWSVVYVGGSFGTQTRIVPEIAWLRDPADRETSWLVGLVVQRRMRAR